MLREVRENSWNLSTFSLLLGKPYFKNPCSFLYRFEHARTVLMVMGNTVLCRNFRGISFLLILLCPILPCVLHSRSSHDNSPALSPSKRTNENAPTPPNARNERSAAASPGQHHPLCVSFYTHACFTRRAGRSTTSKTDISIKDTFLYCQRHELQRPGIPTNADERR